jgi:hypothetical protein
MKTLIALALIFISGCFVARVDWEPERKSATVWTICKDYSFEDPNSWFINSESNKWNLVTPYGSGGTK